MGSFLSSAYSKNIQFQRKNGDDKNWVYFFLLSYCFHPSQAAAIKGKKKEKNKKAYISSEKDLLLFLLYLINSNTDWPAKKKMESNNQQPIANVTSKEDCQCILLWILIFNSNQRKAQWLKKVRWKIRFLLVKFCDYSIYRVSNKI